MISIRCLLVALLLILAATSVSGITPSVTIVVPPNEATLSVDGEMEADLQGFLNDSSITGTLYVDSSTTPTATATGYPVQLHFALTGLAKGGHTLRLVIRDSAGHTASDSVAIHVRDILNVKSPPYNARGDGVTDDTAAIQNALQDGYYAGGATVSIPAGTYRIGQLYFFGDEEVRGDGATATVLKVKDNFIQYNALMSGPAGIANLYMRNLRIDQNLANNTNIDISPDLYPFNVFQLLAAGNIAFQGVHFADVFGVQTLAIGGVAPRSVAGLTVNDCYFNFVRGPSSWVHPLTGRLTTYDVSVLYSDLSGGNVRNSVFAARLGDFVNSCIELHGGGYRVQNVRIERFRVGMNLTTSLVENEEITAPAVVQASVIHNASIGLLLWAFNGRDLQNLTLEQNEIHVNNPQTDLHYVSPYNGSTYAVLGCQYPTFRGIALNWTNDSQGGYRGIRVIGNSIYHDGMPAGLSHACGGVHSAGIEANTVGGTTDLLISGNSIVGPPAIGIHIGNGVSGTVTNNAIVNPGWENAVDRDLLQYGLPTSDRSGILVSGAVGSVQITNNELDDYLGQPGPVPDLNGTPRPATKFGIYAHPDSVAAPVILDGNTCRGAYPLPNDLDTSMVIVRSDPGCTTTLLSFYTLTPCRVIDTRNPNGPLGGPALAASGSRVFTIAGQCGIPPTAQAVSVNLTVTQPTALGDLRVYPGGSSPPLASSINYRPGQTRANNAIVSLGPSGDMALQSDQTIGSVQFILDVNGYFAP